MIMLKKKIDSEKIFIPELLEYIGKDVFITVFEEKERKEMQEFFDCAEKVKIDEKIINRNRELSLI